MMRRQDDRLAASLDHKKHPLGGAFTMRACLMTSIWRPVKSLTAGARSVDVILGSCERDMTNLVNKQKHARIVSSNLNCKASTLNCGPLRTAPHEQKERFNLRFAVWIRHPMRCRFLS